MFLFGITTAAPAAQRVIEEVVVTATKRDQSIQDVPIAMSAFSGDALEARGVNDLAALQSVSPSIQVYNSNSSTNGSTIRIRGVGTTGNNPGLEASVGTFIDGVYRSRSGLGLGELLDVERIEVLRGPQGTLFGKNTPAGAISVVTAEPEFEPSAQVSLEGGNFDHRKVSASTTGPINDQLAWRLAGLWSEREGIYDEITTNEDFDERDRWSLKGQLLWEPTETLSFRLIGDHTDRDESCCPAVFRFVGPTGPAVQAVGGNPVGNFQEEDREVGANFAPFEEVEDSGVSLEADWSLPWGELKSITAYRFFEVERAQDIDFSAGDILRPQNIDESFENFSQEIHFSGTWETIDWLVGAYGYTEGIDTGEEILFSDQGGLFASLITGGVGDGLIPDPGRIPPGSGYVADWASNTQGWSVFTNNTWRFAPDFELNVGLRFSQEEKNATAVINGADFGTLNNQLPTCDALSAVPGFFNSLCNNLSWEEDGLENELTGTVSLAYLLNPDVRVYFAYDRGYKAGGVNLDQQSVQVALADDDNGPVDDRVDGQPVDRAIEFDPEKVNSFELGMKGRWLDETLTVNGALFYMDIDDFQLNTFTGLGFVISNVEEAQSWGAEMEYDWAPAPWLTVAGGVTYANSTYGDDLEPVNQNLENRRLTFAPSWQGSSAVTVRQPLEALGMEAFGTVNLMYRDEHNTGSDLNPIKEQGSYWLFNGRLGARTLDGRYEAVLWGRNLLDRSYRSVVFDSVFQPGSFSATVGEPRMYGVTLRMNLD
jgi:outer membrane receptor protein involved in Fe transport